MARTPRPADNPAQIKGDIDHGRTGDKRPGFDPALSPVATDSEAGGVPLSAEQVAAARKTQLNNGHDEEAVSYNDAMRDFDHDTRKSGSMLWKALAVVAILIVIALIITLAISK